MSDPIFSPDGQFMWTGSEWIPVNTDNVATNIQDSAIAGNVTINQHNIVNQTQQREQDTSQVNWELWIRICLLPLAIGMGFLFLEKWR